MMKNRIRIIPVFVALFSSFLLFDSVSASTNDIMQGYNDSSVVRTELTDGDLGTAQKGSFGAYIDLSKRINYVTKIQYHMINTSPTDVQVRVYYSGGSHIFSIKNVKSDGYINLDVALKDVTSIQFEHVGGSIGQIAEFRMFSTEADVRPPAKITNVSHVFNEDNTVTYQYDLPVDNDFSHLEIYQDNELLKDDYKLNSIKISDLTPEMSYKFKFVSVDTSGNKSEPFISSVTAPIGPDLIAPLEVSEIKKVVSGTSIQFSYKLPIDGDFSHLQVWRNNVMIADNLKINSFNDSDLDYDTTYNYVFKSVDFTGNVSNGSSLTVKTMPEIDEIAPLSPVGVDVISGNASLFLSWSASPENDVVGYNVYIDGVKRNGSPVSGNSFRMTNLVNGQEYSLQVSAVDTSGNESELTQTFVGVPDSAMLPIFKVDTDLSAVAKSTENWFSQLWLVTAFSASIPIAFFVGGRIKSLFFA